MLTNNQLQTIKAAIAADPALAALPNNGDGNIAVADALNILASPDYFVWRTNVSRSDIYNSVNWEGGSWNWTTYKNQGVAEQNAWTQIFMGDQANFAAANVRAGVAAIFTGSAQANAQCDYCLSVGRRKATRIERLLAVATTGGSGTRGAAVNPDTMAFEGAITPNEVEQARNIS